MGQMTCKVLKYVGISALMLCSAGALGCTGCGSKVGANSPQRKETGKLKPGGPFVEIRTVAEAESLSPSVQSIGCDTPDDSLAAAIARNANIKDVYLNPCHDLTDEGVTALSKMSLETLDIGQASKLSDASLKSIAQMRSLRTFRLAHSSAAKITREGLSWLALLDRLDELDLSGNSWVNDDTLVVIAACAPLRELTLRSCQYMSSKGLQVLHNIQWLDLSDCKWMDDSTLVVIGSLKSVSTVVIRECPKITDGAIAEFARRGPDVTLVTGRK